MMVTNIVSLAFAAFFAGIGIAKIILGRPIGDTAAIKKHTEKSIKKYAVVSGILNIFFGISWAVNTCFCRMLFPHITSGQHLLLSLPCFI